MRRVRPGVGDLTDVGHDPISGDPLIIMALVESEWQQTWTA